MVRLQEVEVQAIDAARLEPLIGAERMAQFEHAAEARGSARRRLGAERQLGRGGRRRRRDAADAARLRARRRRRRRWLVIEGTAEFFAITKRIHNGLYGSPGDGGDARPASSATTSGVLRENAVELLALVRPGDIVICPRSADGGARRRAARAPACGSSGAATSALDAPNEWSERAWEFLRPYLEDVARSSFSRAAFAPAWASTASARDPAVDRSVLGEERADHEPRRPRDPRLRRARRAVRPRRRRSPRSRAATARPGGSRRADVVQTGPPPPADTPLVVQVSRWDAMKDMAGVLKGFAQHVDPSLGAQLVLAGPAVNGVADDPEAAEVFDELHERVAGAAARARAAACTSHAADGRRRRERGDRERAPAARGGHRPEEPCRGLRPHRRRGDVEATARRRQRGRRHRRPDRRRRRRPARGRSSRPAGVRRGRRVAAAGPGVRRAARRRTPAAA